MKEPDDGGNGDAVAAGATGANGGGDDDLSDDTRVEERVELVGGVTTTNLFFDRVDGAMPASAQALADESVLERRRRQQRVWVKRKRDAIRAENERKYSSLPTSGIASSDLHLHRKQSVFSGESADGPWDHLGLGDDALARAADLVGGSRKVLKELLRSVSSELLLLLLVVRARAAAPDGARAMTPPLARASS